jgi:hypothetical protein
VYLRSCSKGMSISGIMVLLALEKHCHHWMAGFPAPGWAR